MDANVLALLLFPTRVLVGTVLVIAGAAKLRAGGAQFLSAILDYEIVRGGPAAALARVIPPLEVVCGASLVLGVGFPLTPLVASALMLCFASAITLSLRRGRTHPCGCGEGMRPIQWTLVRRNLIFTLLLLPSVVVGAGTWTAGLIVAPSTDLWMRLFGVAMVLLVALLAVGPLRLRPIPVRTGALGNE